MYRRQSPQYGKVALIRSGGTATGTSCEQVVLDRALAHLAEAAWRDGRIGAVRSQLESVLGELAGLVRPRQEYRLIHGELGPDHLLIDQDGVPVLIDIEGLMFFDVEWEHVFLKLRFREHYRRLEHAGLDERRLSFYTLAMHLSLVAGPLRLLDGDFPDRDFMTSIVDHNVRQSLTFVPG